MLYIAFVRSVLLPFTRLFYAQLILQPHLFMNPRKFTAVIFLLVVGIAAAFAASNKLSAKQARELLRKLGGANLKSDQVRIITVSNGIGGSNAIVEAQIETAIRFKQEKGEWKVADVRLGDQHWESVELLTEAIRREKTRRTELILNKIVAALDAYRKEKSAYLIAENFDKMLDILSPQFLPTPLHFDLWEQPLTYQGTTGGYKLSSAGPDLKIGTSDDLVIEKR